MTPINRAALVAVLFFAVLTGLDGFYILNEGRQAVVTQFGAPVGAPITKAGFYFKLPVVQQVHFFEKRIYIWDGDPNQIPTNDKTFIFLDVTARWRIADALKFLQAVKDESRAMSVLDDIIDGTVRDLVNKNNLVEIIRSSDWAQAESVPNAFRSEDVHETVELGRDKVIGMIFEQASKITLNYGIELIDVMFKRVNYIDSVQAKVFERMISERKRIAAEKRSFGEGEKAEILGRLDRGMKEITSKASQEAQEIRGRADAEAATIYADAYNRDPEFYSFYKTLESYKDVAGENSRLIIPLESDFFQFLSTARAGGKPAAIDPGR